MPMEIQYQVHGHITRTMNIFNLTIQKRMHTVIKQCLTCNERKQITFMIVQQCIHCVIMAFCCNVYSPSKAVSSHTLFPTVQVYVNCTSMAFCLLLSSLRAVSLNIGLRATTSLRGRPNNRLVK